MTVHERVQLGAAIATALGMDKLVLLLAIIGATTALAVTGKVDPAAPISLMTAIVGYVFGASSPGTVQAAQDSGQTKPPDPS